MIYVIYSDKIDMNMFSNYVSVFLFLSLLCLTECGSSSQKRPNIVLVVTDDQDSVLGGLTPMRRTQDLIGKSGATFINSFVAAPICCPSRSSILTGMYPHNHHTVNNTLEGGCSNTTWQKDLEPKTFAAILQKERNYKTFYAGKYLNEYGMKESGGPEHVPVGWDEWRGLVGNSRYYNFTLSHNGVPHTYDNEEYLTDVIKDMALEFIDAESKNDQPLLMFLAPPAPHAPFQPAPRHKEAFEGIIAPETPNFNVPVGKDKHWIMQMTPSPLPNSTLQKLDDIFRARWQTLLSVDEMIEEVVKKLESSNILDNTYIIVTSDNGYHIGQFSQPFDKRQPYETDIRVPLIVRGPNINPQEILQNPVINIDLAPTILTLAGLVPPKDMDGVPMPLFPDAESTLAMLETNNVSSSNMYDRQMLIEYSGEGSDRTSDCPWGSDHNLFMCLPEFFCKCQDSKNNTYGCVRHLHPSIDFIYCAFNDSKQTEEAYDISEDPFQLVNIISGLMPAIKFKYQNTLQHLRDCKGSNCNDYHDYF